MLFHASSCTSTTSRHLNAYVITWRFCIGKVAQLGLLPNSCYINNFECRCWDVGVKEHCISFEPTFSDRNAEPFKENFGEDDLDCKVILLQYTWQSAIYLLGNFSTGIETGLIATRSSSRNCYFCIKVNSTDQYKYLHWRKICGSKYYV